jgi:tetratricopeptide (TPR) repeat protein
LDEAIAAYKSAIKIDPQSETSWQSLGWVYYRRGDFELSIESLKKSCEFHQHKTGDCGQWTVLALAHGRLAEQKDLPEPQRMQHQAEAQHWLVKAAAQIDRHPNPPKNNPTWKSVVAFRVEAEQLLGTPKAPESNSPPKDTPKDPLPEAPPAVP